MSASRAARALGDAFWGGVGQLGSMIAGVATALLLPRALGASDYGDWVLLRGLMSFVVMLSVMGTPEITARFHVSNLAAGRDESAALVFKTVAVLRAGLTVAAVLLFLVLAPGRLDLPGGAGDLAWLSLGLVAQSASLTFLLLLYASRGFARLAAFYTIQPAVVPLLVVGAVREAGFDAVPVAVAAGDVAMLAFVMALSARQIRWPAGWPAAPERREILRFGGVVGAASLALGAYQTLVPFAMDVRGYDADAIGYVGLAGRLAGLVGLLLAAVSASLFPSFTHVMQQQGREALLRGYDIATRAGLALALFGAGCTALAASAVVGPLFGGEFRDAALVVTIGMAANVPLWLGGQCARLSWLMNRPHTHLAMTLALLAVSGLALALLPVDARGGGAALALVLGAVAYALVGGWLMREHLPGRASLVRSVPPAILSLGLVCAEPWIGGDAGWRAGLLVGWTLVFAFVCLRFGLFTRDELRRLATLAATLRRGTDPGACTEPPAT